jgi:hypothetical protein
MKTAKKPGAKKLVLGKETIRTLETQDLNQVVGGSLQLNSPTGWVCTRS